MWHYVSRVTESHEMDRHVTDKNATEMKHEPFFSDSVSAHNQTCNRVSPMSMNNLKSKHTSPMIVHGDQTT